MPRPVLPLGRLAPLVLIAVGVALLVAGLLASSREMVAVGVFALVAWVVAFPLSHLLLGRDEHPDD